MTKAMKTREVQARLKKYGCVVLNDEGPHTTWGCPCGQHKAYIPRHREVSPGVIRDTIKRMECLKKGWLQ